MVKNLPNHRLDQGFTLVELLVIIAIIAILAAILVIIINPSELTKRSRDAARIQDLNALGNTITTAVAGASSVGVLCDYNVNPLGGCGEGYNP